MRWEQNTCAFCTVVSSFYFGQGARQETCSFGPLLPSTVEVVQQYLYKTTQQATKDERQCCSLQGLFEISIFSNASVVEGHPGRYDYRSADKAKISAALSHHDVLATVFDE